MTMATDEQDPFSWIIEFCKPNDSQEANFPDCPFAREFENFVESNPSQFSSQTPFSVLTPSQPSEIVVVSLPGSSGSGSQSMMEEDAVFHTPPEHHYHSHLSSSEDQNPNELCAEGLRVADAGSDGTTKFRVSKAGLDDEPGTKRVRVVAGEEYDGDTVPLGETEVVEIEGDEGLYNSDVIVSSDCDGEEVGGLIKDGANNKLGGEIKYAKDIEVPVGENSDSSPSLESGKIEKNGGFEKAVGDAKIPKDSHGGGVLKTSGKTERIGGYEKAVEDAKMPKDNHGDGGAKTSGKIEKIGGFEKAVEDAKLHKDSPGDGVVKSSGNIESIGGYEKAVEEAKMPKDSRCTIERIGGSEKAVKDAKSPKDSHGDGDVETSGKRIEELRNADGECEGRRERAVGRGRQLPPLLKGEGEAVVEKKIGLFGLLDVLKAVLKDTDGGCEDVDFIETAKRKGMKFPRPRYWPPLSDQNS